MFAPGWAASLVTLLLLPVLIWLGCWQLQRADEKRALMAQAVQGKQQLMSLTQGNADNLPRYQHVTVTGHFDGVRQILLDNMPSTDPQHPGVPGYRVLTPFILDSAQGNFSILVDRGWVRGTPDRNQLPVVTVNTDVRQLQGLMDELPRPGIRAGDAGIQSEHWPQVLNYPTIAELRSLYGNNLLSRIVLLDAEQPDGYERFWSIDIGFTPERHIGYAVQWFGLALTLLIIYLIVNIKRIEISEERP